VSIENPQSPLWSTENVLPAAVIDPDNTQLLHYDLVLMYRAVRDWPALLRTRARLGAALERENAPERGPADTSEDEFYATGSLKSWQKLVAGTETNKQMDQSDPGLNLDRYLVALLERKYSVAEQAIARVQPEFLKRIEMPSKTFFKAKIQVARHEAPERVAATLAPDIKEAQDAIAKDPDHYDNHSTLGVFLIFAGKKEDALREGFRGEELASPRVKDDALARLALIYTHTGKEDEAVKLLEVLLTRPGLVGIDIVSITLADLRFDPQWDPLRNNARFKKLVAGPEPVTVY